MPVILLDATFSSHVVRSLGFHVPSFSHQSRSPSLSQVRIGYLSHRDRARCRGSDLFTALFDDLKSSAKRTKPNSVFIIFDTTASIGDSLSAALSSSIVEDLFFRLLLPCYLWCCCLRLLLCFCFSWWSASLCLLAVVWLRVLWVCRFVWFPAHGCGWFPLSVGVCKCFVGLCF